jgi:hypothetical protein
VKEKEDKSAPPQEGVPLTREPWRAGNENDNIIATATMIDRDNPGEARATETTREIDHWKRKIGQ